MTDKEFTVEDLLRVQNILLSEFEAIKQMATVEWDKHDHENVRQAIINAAEYALANYQMSPERYFENGLNSLKAYVIQGLQKPN